MMNFFLATTGNTTAAAADSTESAIAVMPVEDVIPEITKNLDTFSTQASGWFSSNSEALLYWAIGVAITVAVAFLFDRVLLRNLGKLVMRTKTGLDDNLLNSIAAPIRWFILETGFILSLRTSLFGPEITMNIVRVYYAVATLTVVWGLMQIIDVFNVYFLKIAERTQGDLDKLLIDLLRRVIKAVIWSVALLFVAQNIFGWNVSAILAGAGVIGLAVAFAAQNTIANVFGALMLIVDKPFKIGNFIEIGDTTGIVENVGLRSTRLRSLDGTLWVLPNREVADGKVRNISGRPNLKYAFDLGLVYSTPSEKMERAMEIVREILAECPLIDMEKQPPLIFFTEFRDSSLNISVVLWFQTLDFAAMQNAKTAINLEILRRFNAEGLSFAYPSRTLYLAGENGGAVAVSKEN